MRPTLAAAPALALRAACSEASKNARLFLRLVSEVHGAYDGANGCSVGSSPTTTRAAPGRNPCSVHSMAIHEDTRCCVWMQPHLTTYNQLVRTAWHATYINGSGSGGDRSARRRSQRAAWLACACARQLLVVRCKSGLPESHPHRGRREAQLPSHRVRSAWVAANTRQPDKPRAHAHAIGVY